MFSPRLSASLDLLDLIDVPFPNCAKLPANDVVRVLL